MILPSKTKETLFKTSLAALGGGFLAYEVARTLRVSITFDEAVTYLTYVKSGLLSLFNFNEANNHLVNSVLTKVLGLLGGNHDLIVRLPNLLGYVLYLWFGWLLLKRFVSRTSAVLGFVLLNTNPYLLDFFSLCRGYGLSLGFLMAALYFFVLFLSRLGEDGPSVDRYRPLTRSLSMAAVAVLCNFSLLNVYLGLLAVGVLALVIANRKQRDSHRTDPGIPAPRFGKTVPVLLILLIVVFNLLVVSQHLDLTDALYEPVTVRIPGLAAAQVDDVIIKGWDYKKEERPFPQANGEWSIGRGIFLTGLHFRIPAAALDGVQGLEILIGGQTFRIDSRELRDRLGGRNNLIFDSDETLSLKRATLSLFKPAINWGGDKNHLSHVALRFLLLMAIFALAGAVVFATGRLLSRAKVLDREPFARLAVPTLALGGFIVYPLFILKTNRQLWWGGEKGFFQDTWSSLVDGSFYNKVYSPHQDLFVGLFLVFSVILFAAAVALHGRRKRLSRLLPGGLFLAVTILAALSTILQRLLFDNRLLIGRTALFFIPLAVLFLVFALHAFGETGRAAKWASLSLLAGAALLSAYHFSRTANTAVTVEWKSDADTKLVISDLAHIKAERYPQVKTIQLGIDWVFFPSFMYYQRQADLSWLDVRWYAEREKNDLYYLERAFNPDRMVLIKRYPASGNILVQLKSGD